MHSTNGADVMDLAQIKLEAGIALLDNLVTQAEKRKLTKQEVRNMIYLGYTLGERSDIVKSELAKADMERKSWVEDPSTWLDD